MMFAWSYSSEIRSEETQIYHCYSFCNSTISHRTVLKIVIESHRSNQAAWAFKKCSANESRSYASISSNPDTVEGCQHMKSGLESLVIPSPSLLG